MNQIKRDQEKFFSEIFESISELGFFGIILLILIYPFIWIIKKVKKYAR